MEEYFTPQEVADILKIRNVKTIYRYIDENQFPNVKIRKRSYLIPKSDLTDFLEGDSKPTPPPTSGRRIISPGR